MSVQASSSIAAGGCYRPPGCDPSNPSNASTTMQGGEAVFENDNYRITMNDDNTVTINNKHTGECYQAWGDPHMKVDGQQAFDFWGTTTLKLEDGTNVTIETTPWANDPSMTLSSKVTITNGGYGVQVSGIDSNKTGDLKIDEAEGWGKVLDWAVSDGNVLQENPAGKGFVAVDGNGIVRKVDQAYINQTDLLKGGAEKLQDQFKDAFRVLSGLLSISFAGLFLSAMEVSGCQRQASPRPSSPRDSDGRMYTGGSPNFDESTGRYRAPRYDAHLRASLSLELTLARWRC